jgi:excisionase family DNA binding protein
MHDFGKLFEEAIRRTVREAVQEGMKHRGLVDVDGAAAYLQLSRSTLFEMLGNGELKAVRRGRVVRFDLNDLDDWARLHKG